MSILNISSLPTILGSALGQKFLLTGFVGHCRTSLSCPIKPPQPGISEKGKSLFAVQISLFTKLTLLGVEKFLFSKSFLFRNAFHLTKDRGFLLMLSDDCFLDKKPNIRYVINLLVAMRK